MILNYGEFLNEKEWAVTDDAILNNRRAFYAEAFTQFLNEDELTEANNLINEGLFDKFGFSRIERLNENELYESLVLEWNLLQKLADKAKQAVKVVKDEGKKALSKLQQGLRFLRLCIFPCMIWKGLIGKISLAHLSKGYY